MSYPIFIQSLVGKVEEHILASAEFEELLIQICSRYISYKLKVQKLEMTAA